MKFKKLLAVVLAFAMILSTMSFTVSAETADYSDVIASVESVKVEDSNLTFAVNFNGKEPVESYLTANAENPWLMNVLFTAMSCLWDHFLSQNAKKFLLR